MLLVFAFRLREIVMLLKLDGEVIKKDGCAVLVILKRALKLYQQPNISQLRPLVKFGHDQPL